MLWKIPAYLVRYYSNEPNGAISNFRHIGLFVKDTYIDYTGLDYYKEATSLLLQTANVWEQTPNTGSNASSGDCNNTPALTATVEDDHVTFKVDGSGIQSSEYAFAIKTRLDGAEFWVDYIGMNIHTKGEVFAKFMYADGCETQYLLYEYELDGTLTPKHTTNNVTSTGTTDHDAGDIVYYMGMYWEALVDTNQPPFSTEDWAPIVFDINTQQGREHQDVLDQALGQMISLRIVRAALATAKSPLKADRLLGSGTMNSDGATKADYEMRVHHADASVNMYIKELQRIAVALDKTDWPIYPSAKTCGSKRSTSGFTSGFKAY